MLKIGVIVSELSYDILNWLDHAVIDGIHKFSFLYSVVKVGIGIQDIGLDRREKDELRGEIVCQYFLLLYLPLWDDFIVDVQQCYFFFLFVYYF